MNKFAKGMLAGGLISGVGVGLSMLMQDPTTKRKVQNQGRKITNKAENLFDL